MSNLSPSEELFYSGKGPSDDNSPSISGVPPMTPDRPTELRETAREIIRRLDCGEPGCGDMNEEDITDVSKLIEARSRTDQRELLERIKNFTCDDCKKYPNPENGCWDCMGKLQDNVYAELARLEGEGKQ